MPDKRTVAPYLTIRNAADAIDFYKRVFAAEENMRHPADDGKRLLHASLTINGGVVLLSDEFPEHGAADSPQSLGGTSVSISLNFDTPAEVDATHARGPGERRDLRAGAARPFWGGRFAMMEDPFGHRWMFSSPHQA